MIDSMPAMSLFVPVNDDGVASFIGNHRNHVAEL